MKFRPKDLLTNLLKLQKGLKEFNTTLKIFEKTLENETDIEIIKRDFKTLMQIYESEIYKEKK